MAAGAVGGANPDPRLIMRGALLWGRRARSSDERALSHVDGVGEARSAATTRVQASAEPVAACAAVVAAAAAGADAALAALERGACFGDPFVDEGVRSSASALGAARAAWALARAADKPAAALCPAIASIDAAGAAAAAACGGAPVLPHGVC